MTANDWEQDSLLKNGFDQAFQHVVVLILS